MEVTTKQLNQEVTTLKELKKQYKSKKEESTIANKAMVAQEIKLLGMMERADVKSYRVEGIGLITRVDKFSVATPKSNEQKVEFFDWIRTSIGDDAVLAYSSVNSASLNKLYNEKNEEYAAKGIVFDMPGVGLPTTRTSISFRTA